MNLQKLINIIDYNLIAQLQKRFPFRVIKSEGLCELVQDGDKMEPARADSTTIPAFTDYGGLNIMHVLQQGTYSIKNENRFGSKVLYSIDRQIQMYCLVKKHSFFEVDTQQLIDIIVQSLPMVLTRETKNAVEIINGDIEVRNFTLNAKADWMQENIGGENAFFVINYVIQSTEQNNCVSCELICEP